MSTNSELLVSKDVLSIVKRYLENSRLCFPELIAELNYSASEKQLSFTQWSSVKAAILTAADHPFIGFEIAKAIHTQNFGVLGYLFQSSPTLMHGLSAMQRYHALLYSGVSFHLHANSPNTSAIFWQFKLNAQDRLFDEFITRSTLTLMNDSLQAFVVKPIQVNIRHALNARELSYYELEFGCPVKQNCEYLELIFNSADIDLPIFSADAGLHEILESQAQSLTSQVPESDEFVSNVRDGLIHSIHEGKPNVEYVSALLGTSPRTLHRKLEQRNLKFRHLLRDVRKKLSEHYLALENLSIVEVAFLLGYSEQSTFTRAFSSWHGTTPAQFRKSRKKRVLPQESFFV